MGYTTLETYQRKHLFIYLFIMLNKNTHRPILYHKIPDVLLFLKISFFFMFSDAVNMN